MAASEWVYEYGFCIDAVRHIMMGGSLGQGSTCFSLHRSMVFGGLLCVFVSSNAQDLTEYIGTGASRHICISYNDRAFSRRFASSEGHELLLQGINRTSFHHPKLFTRSYSNREPKRRFATERQPEMCPSLPLSTLCRLDNFGGWQLGIENPIPESTRDSKSVLIVGEVMLEVVFLELAVIRRQTNSMISTCKI